MTVKKDGHEYNANAIKAVSAHTHLLKRMSLTFGPLEGSGDVFSKQKGVAVREILDNALDEVRSGHGTRVRLSFFKDRAFAVQDAGRGIPVDVGVDSEGRPCSGIYLALGVIQSGGKFETDSKRFSSGLNGVGASSTVHVSRRADVTVYRNKKCYRLSFQDGTPGFFAGEDDPDSAFTPLTDLTQLDVSPDRRSAAEKKLFPTGTTVKCWLRDEVFSSQYPYDDQDIIDRLKGTAFLVPTLEAEVHNELLEIEDPATGVMGPQEEVFHFPDGPSALVDLTEPDQPLMETVFLSTTGKYTEKNVSVLLPDGKTVVTQDVEREVPIELAFRYGDGYAYTMSSFVNTIQTKLGGVHETAFERAMVGSFNERFKSMRGLIPAKADLPIDEDFKEGLTVVLSVQISEPNFTSQSKEALSGSDVQRAIKDALAGLFDGWIADRKNADALQAIATKVATASKNRQAARDQRDLNRKKNALRSESLPEKLVDCEVSGTDDAELYICEGDSALSSMKAARDGRIHALLPIRGKIINAHKQSIKMVMNNTEVQDIIKTLGAGAGSDFDMDKMRYGRVFLAVDADPDGNSIATLVYALFWHLFRPVLEAGRLYKVETPLFVIGTHEGRKSRKVYARNDRERDERVAELEAAGVRYTISRLKGLGEMMADDLEETAIHPDTRVITQVLTKDLEKAMEALELAFGEDTDNRKRWIESYEVDEEEMR